MYTKSIKLFSFLISSFRHISWYKVRITIEPEHAFACWAAFVVEKLKLHLLFLCKMNSRSVEVRISVLCCNMEMIKIEWNVIKIVCFKILSFCLSWRDFSYRGRKAVKLTASRPRTTCETNLFRLNGFWKCSEVLENYLNFSMHVFCTLIKQY